MAEQIKYHIAGGMSRSQLDAMNEKVLETLEGIGMDVQNGNILEFVRNIPGFSVCGGNVRFSRGLIAECMQKQKAARIKNPSVPPEDRPWRLRILTGYPFFLADYKTLTVKPFMESDVIRYTKLVDTLHPRGVTGSTPGAPQDIDPMIRDIRSYQIGEKYCRGGGEIGNISGPAVARWLYRLLELKGRPKGLGLFAVNPLKAEGATFDTLYEFRKELKYIMVACMPQMGVSSPVGILGTYVVALAAVWGSYALANALTGIEDMGFFCYAWPTHMKTMDIAYGTPEAAFSELVNRQLTEYYGWGENDSNCFHSSAPVPDIQAGYQRGAFGMMAALNGDRCFRFGGLLGTDLVFSPEMLLGDLEAMEYTKRVAEGIAFDEGAFMMEAIRETGASGTFLDHETTLGYRGHLWDPRLFVHESTPTWAMGGAKTMLDRAHDEIEGLIESFDYRLDEDTERELDRICLLAEKDLLGN